MGRVALISGASGGIGASTAMCLIRHGYTVYEVSRGGKSHDGIRHITADVTSLSSLLEAASLIEKECGFLDLLVCNAGMGISGAIEFTRDEDAKKIMDVNFFGVFHLISAMLPLLRKSRQPKIIAVSSLAAAIPIPFQAFYSASKAAVSAFMQALANELRPFGIKVSTVLPGDTATGFTAAREKNSEGASLYGNSIERAVVAMEKDEKNGMSPDKIASLIHRIDEKKHPRSFYTAGMKNKIFLLLQKLLPATLTNRIVGRIYR